MITRAISTHLQTWLQMQTTDHHCSNPHSPVFSPSQWLLEVVYRSQINSCFFFSNNLYHIIDFYHIYLYHCVVTTGYKAIKDYCFFPCKADSIPCYMVGRMWCKGEMIWFNLSHIFIFTLNLLAQPRCPVLNTIKEMEEEVLFFIFPWFC